MKPTQEQVIAWMEEASGGRQPDGWGVMLDREQLERFAALAYEAGRKDENEDCAKVCEELGYYAKHGGWGCADAIRARREQ